MPVQAHRLLIAVLFVVMAALQIRYTVMTVHLLADPASAISIFSLDAVTLAFFEVDAAQTAAGVKRGDVVLAEDGIPVHSRVEQARIQVHHKIGQTTTLTLRRGQGAPFEITVPISRHPEAAHDFALVVIVINVITPWSCILLGFLVAFRRPGDPVAWSLLFFLLSLSQIEHATNLNLSWESPFSWLAMFCAVFSSRGLICGWMWFTIRFPDPRSPYRVWPWAPLYLGLPYVATGVVDGVWLATLMHDPKAAAWLTPVANLPGWFMLSWSTVLITLGFTNLFNKLFRETNPSQRRRLRWVSLGLFLGLFPILTLLLLGVVFHRDFEDIILPVVFSPILIPLTLAYAVLVNRLLDVGVFFRQGLLASKTVDAVRVIFLATLIYIAISLIAQPGSPGPLRIAELVACVLGFIVTRRGAVWLRKWVDCHFFQEAVNSEHLLVELAGEVRGMRDPEILLRTVTDRITSAMHASSVTVLAAGDQALRHPMLRDDELLVPVSTGGEVLCVLSLGPKRSEEPYSNRDITLLESVASQTGLALENTRLAATVAAEAAHRERITSELEIARTVQERLFPKTAPRVPGLDLAGRCQPAQTVGGDYYDFFTTPAGATGFAIGDIAGKGVPAALLMAGLQASLRGLTLAGISDLAELMAKLNVLMYDASPANRFATFFCCLYEPDSGRLRYSSAGHNPALLCRANADQPEWLKTRGTALGLTRKSTYEQAELTLHPGDRLILYTDGVTEARNPNGEEFGEDRLSAAMQSTHSSARQILDSLMAATTTFASGATQHDDITLIVAACDVGQALPPNTT